ncbi:hypothetical protein GCM10007931_31190 [Vibrio algivorus]|uniref:DNA-binding protein H-NS-like N-terminal domain-containing protein n=2 Tax=Vibrio algivorus TaxID=1667024 RepID=A0ABQ6ESL2_9VIBR|nr:hypothetical protein GCM10007931_31190 [Vibrio algivorus]
MNKPMSLTTYEMARILEQLEESPEKIMFGKLLTELGNQSQERIRSAAKQVPLELLRDIIYQFQVIADSRKGEQVQLLAEQLKAQGLSVDDLKRYMEKTK